MKKTYYKIVSVQARQKKSWMRDIIPKSSVVTYILDSWVEAMGDSRLFVFDNLEDAIKNNHGSGVIYECEVSGVIKEKMSGVNLFTEDIPEYWEIFNRVRKQKKKNFVKRFYTEAYKNKLVLSAMSATLVKKVKLKKVHNYV